MELNFAKKQEEWLGLGRLSVVAWSSVFKGTLHCIMDIVSTLNIMSQEHEK